MGCKEIKVIPEIPAVSVRVPSNVTVRLGIPANTLRFLFGQIFLSFDGMASFLSTDINRGSVPRKGEAVLVYKSSVYRLIEKSVLIDFEQSGIRLIRGRQCRLIKIQKIFYCYFFNGICFFAFPSRLFRFCFRHALMRRKVIVLRKPKP